MLFEWHHVNLTQEAPLEACVIFQGSIENIKKINSLQLILYYKQNINSLSSHNKCNQVNIRDHMCK